ncbi:NADH:ubiquinone oxidoreductase family protein [Salix suchowensis]|nr:NADH:ubiquinone oxidoreductase family protein [Salix suchowensis]KAG5249279.1 NADH:ubiquinone oxidoreductase family protein [Salix suchowensis]
MSKLLARLAGYLSNRTLVGVDKVGNRYFTRIEEIDGIMKEKRWVVFKGEEDPTSLPEKENLWGRKQKNQSIQNQPDRVQPSSQGHGSHRHEMDYTVMFITWFGSQSHHRYDP